MRNLFWIGVLVGCVALIGVVTCGPDDPPAADVDDYLETLPSWAEFSPLRESANDEVGESRNESETGSNDLPYDCNVQNYSITETPDEIVVFSPDSDVMWLGALLQGSGYAGGLGSLEELPVRERAPLTIFIDVLGEDAARTIANPTPATVQQAIGELATQAEESGATFAGSVNFRQTTAHTLEQSALELGLSVSYLAGDAKASLSIDSSVDKNALTAYFIEKMFTVSVVLPQTPSAFFSEAFTAEKLQEQVDLGRIGPDNPPTYIANIVYGRMLMVTMTSSESITEMKAGLEASYKAITVDVDATKLDVVKNSEIKVTAIGGNPEGVTDLIKSGELGQYFDAENPLTAAAPLSYTVRNLADNSIAKVSETTEYAIKECTLDEREATGEKYRVRVAGIKLTDSSCDPGVVEVLHWFRINGEEVVRQTVDLQAGQYRAFDSAVSPAQEATVFFDPTQGQPLKVEGEAWDVDPFPFDNQFVGSWSKEWKGTGSGTDVPVGLDQPFDTDTPGRECDADMYLTIESLGFVYD